ncbi:carbonic anhydrase [Halarsenatibacter silvermanii]|uniref:Carbonic anhydrase n=1 Tax=Halarsenatibacter silvermanii TaxID=321763 RepID=A0A1G9SUJ9_9FIRM|nr:carbonic anhydrase [Halarsenatibacter silvermanii]SDM39014.1 hypothetical protein SAMN04488692_13115 [Halarsenatibacter silvermanii]
MEKGVFMTVINCIDGRVQTPVLDWFHENYEVDHVDMITEPGPNLILAKNEDQKTVESIKERVKVSTEEHNSERIAVVGHYDCAANPAGRAGQIEHIKDAVEVVNSWISGADVLGLWVDSDWQVEVVD